MQLFQNDGAMLLCLIKLLESDVTHAEIGMQQSTEVDVTTWDGVAQVNALLIHIDGLLILFGIK